MTTLAQIANRSYDYNGRDNVYYAPMQYKRFRYFRQYEYSPRTIRGLLEYKPIIARPPFYFLLSVLNGFSSLYIPPPLSRFIPPFFSSLLSLSFVTFKNAEARIDRGHGRNSRVWGAFPFHFFLTFATISPPVRKRRLFRFYFHDELW